MDIFHNQCSESLGFDSMLATNPLNSPLQGAESPTHLNFNSSPFFATIPASTSTVINNSNIVTLSSTGASSSGPNDVVLPSIFVKVPMQINQQYQQQSQSRSNPEEIKCEHKSEPIKRELGDLRALVKGTAMVQLPSISESYLQEDRQDCRDEELRVHCCEFCPFITLVEQSLRDHVRTKHPNRERETVEFLNCPACENKFRQRNLMELHLESDHMMVQSEVTMLMERRFPRVQEVRESTGCEDLIQDANAVPVSESQSTIAPEQNRRRIYIKNVQLLKKPDVIEQENVHQAQQHQQQQQQQQTAEQHQQPPQQNGKIFIRNVSLLQNANYVQNVDNVFQNASGLHESKYSFVVPAPSPNSQSPPISIGESLNGTQQRSKIFIRNVDILKNPMIPITPPTIASTCEMNRTSSSENLYTTPPPTMVSPATSVSSMGTPSSMGFSGLNMVILPTPICSSNSSTPPTISTPPSMTVANFDSVQSQQPLQRKSKIFIKNISVLKQPTIHLKSVDELNLMTIDQLQLQNLLPPTNSAQSMDDSDLSGNGGQQSIEEEENFSGILDEVPSDLDDFHVEGNQYQEMQGCDSACGSVTEQESYQQDFNDFIIIHPGDSSENVTYEESPDLLRIAPHTTEMMSHQQLTQSPPNLPESQQYHDTNKDILFVCAEEIINLDPPVPQESASSEPTSIQTSAPPEPPSTPPPQVQQGRIYVSDNLMEPSAPATLPMPPPPAGLPVHNSTISTLNQIEQIHINLTSNHPAEYQLPQASSSMEKERIRSRGRPKGARQTGITKLKKLYTNLTPMEEGYKCDLGDCGARFRQPETLTYHKKCHIPTIDGTTADGNRCPECGSHEFRNWNTLHTHLWREHSIDMELYSCHLCNFKTPVLCRLNNTHMKIHSDEKNFICVICNKAFKNNKQLRNHRRSHRDLQQIPLPTVDQLQGMEARIFRHESNLPVKCVKCGLMFPNQKFLKSHVESRHAPTDGSEVKGRMKCSLCGMMFKTRYLLQSHVAKHSDEKRFKCSSCDFSCNDHNSMRRHKMRHNSEAHMYRCSYCDYTSIQSTSYRNHLERMHADVANNLLYKCSDCSFVSISELKYQLHRTKHKPEAENSVEKEPDPNKATIEPAEQTTEEDPERLCESVNSDVVIVEKDSSEPPMDAFSLIPLNINEQHDPQFPLIRPAGFAHNLSKVDNFYGYGNAGPVENGSHHYKQPEAVQALKPTVERQNDVEMIETVVGDSAADIASSGGSNGHQQHGFDSMMNNIASMVPLTYGESALGS